MIDGLQRWKRFVRDEVISDGIGTGFALVLGNGYRHSTLPDDPNIMLTIKFPELLSPDAIASQVATFVRHPVYPNSYKVLETALDDLERYREEGFISEELRSLLADQILASDHFKVLVS